MKNTWNEVTLCLNYKHLIPYAYHTINIYQQHFRLQLLASFIHTCTINHFWYHIEYYQYLQNNCGGSIINITATLHYNGHPFQVCITQLEEVNFSVKTVTNSGTITLNTRTEWKAYFFNCKNAFNQQPKARRVYDEVVYRKVQIIILLYTEKLVKRETIEWLGARQA